jgi:hypothetical protein
MRLGVPRTLALSATALFVAPAFSGGYLNVTSGPGTPTPVKWGGTITVRLDQGTLGSLTNVQANTLAQNALNRWVTASIPESAVGITIGPQLPQDNTGASAPQYGNAGDGINPIIYDTDGTLTDAALGAGASNSVIGFAGISSFFPASATVAEGQAVLNGKFIDGVGSPTDITQSQMEGVFTHEIGHFLNLDHAQFNDAAVQSISPGYTTGNFDGYPTMYPLVHGDIADLELDDKAWISRLYPTVAFNTKVKITGTVRTSANALVNGINIVARRASNPIAEAVSNVSGHLDITPSAIDGSTNEAQFEIPGLEPNTAYFLEFEEIKPGFSGGSRVGPISPVNTDTLGAGEFVNESGFESNADSVSRSTSFVTPGSGSLTGTDLRLNGAPTATNVNEVDTGAIFAANAQTIVATPGLLTIAGNGSTAETGNVAFFGGETDIEDWFAIAPAAGLEIYEVSMTMAGTLDADLYVASFNQPSGGLSAPGLSQNDGVGVAESITTTFDTTRFGAGTATGILYIGVDSFSGFGVYTITVRSRVATSDAVVVSGVSGGTLNAGSGTFTITGQGFKNTGGAPTVALSNGGLNVGAVTFVNSTTLNVGVTRNGGYVNPSDTDVTVTNQAGGGSYSGKRLTVPTIPVQLSGFEVE